MMKIFVGSSTEGLPQVQEIEDELGRDFEIEQWRRDAFPSGESYLQSLCNATRRVDFAILVLTPDDKKVERGVETSSARDNCIFEAGLFMGALDPKRVFLVSSLRANELPSDLMGINVLDGQKNGKMLAQDVRREARPLGPYRQGDNRIIPLTYQQLLDLEVALDSERRVVVQSGQPLELEATPRAKNVRGYIAERVRSNMAREVFYHYFFHADPDTVDTIAALCRRLATFDGEGQRLPENEIKKNLVLMRDQLRIHFLPKQPLMDFCIHDLMSPRPRLYIRNRDYEMFYLWSAGMSAKEFADDVKTTVRDAWRRKAIFSPTGLYDLDLDAEYKALLKERCLAYFDGECQATAADYLFGS
jgi:CAP12/Pycsar effector protein, TIR domain